MEAGNMTTRGYNIAGTVGLILLSLVSPLPAQQPCERDDAFNKLDFWLGEWDVFVGDQKVGTNRIEKILSGCAVMEHWTAASGSQGKSLFYYTPATGEWTQVWVTEDTTRPGGLKVKQLVLQFDDGGLRFQGDVPLPNGGSYLDRTTLTPLEAGQVRQHIEISRDDGRTWETTFDAGYVPKEH
jgi:hypothetical protein